LKQEVADYFWGIYRFSKIADKAVLNVKNVDLIAHIHYECPLNHLNPFMTAIGIE